MKCNQMECDDAATYKVFWPGNKSLPMCKYHVQTAIVIGNSMGICIHVEEIPREDKE